MKITSEEIMPLLLDQDLSEIELVRGIRELSQIFNSGREKESNYFLSSRMVSAYAAFYLPTNLPKLEFVFQQLSGPVLVDFRSCNFVDVGMGPGTYSLAFLDQVGKDYTGVIYGIDRSVEMLKQAKICLNHFFPNQKKIHFREKMDSKPSGKNILFFGHSLHEMGLASGMALIDKILPEYMVVLGPGTMNSFKLLLEMRKEMRIRGYAILYPCPNIEEECPMQGDHDWCHQVIQMVHHASIERLSQLVHRDRKTMPLIAHVYSRQASMLSNSGRLVRKIKETKCSFEWEICGPLSNKLYRVEILKKNLSRALQKEMNNWNVGIKIHYAIEKELSDKLRVKLISS